MFGQQAGFDRETAGFLAECCLQSYKQRENNGEVDVPDGYCLVKKFKATAAGISEWFGFILQSDNSIVVAFRGTSSNRDWAVDVEAFQASYIFSDTFVHAGFASVYESCRDAIVSALQSLPRPARIYVTGHSLGGALAMLHALDVAVNMQLCPVMYNFGGPRVGNPEFTAAYTRRVPDSFRIVNAYDIIPLFPPRVLGASLNGQRRLWFYQHVQGKKRIRAQTGSIRGNHAITTYLGALRSQS